MSRLTPDPWRAVGQHRDQVLELPENERAAFCARRSPGAAIGVAGPGRVVLATRGLGMGWTGASRRLPLVPSLGTFIYRLVRRHPIRKII